jgi:glycosyltransferase involved in cell wall biosynthesis
LLFVGKIRPFDAGQNDPRQLARSYDLASKTIIVDEYIPEELISYYFCAADTLIVSYRKDFMSHSSALMDAGQYGLPVIAIDTGSTGDDVRKYGLGLTFAPDDPMSLREALLSFLKLGDEEKQSMEEGLRRYANTFSWDQVAKSHLGIYRILSESRRDNGET